MHHGTKITGKVISGKRKPSPLANGGLQIIINIEVDLEDKEKLAILTKQEEQVNYPLDSMMKVRMIMKMLITEYNDNDA